MRNFMKRLCSIITAFCLLHLALCISMPAAASTNDVLYGANASAINTSGTLLDVLASETETVYI